MLQLYKLCRRINSARGCVAGKDKREPCASGNRAEKGREKSVTRIYRQKSRGVIYYKRYCKCCENRFEYKAFAELFVCQKEKRYVHNEYRCADRQRKKPVEYGGYPCKASVYYTVWRKKAVYGYGIQNASAQKIKYADRKFSCDFISYFLCPRFLRRLRISYGTALQDDFLRPLKTAIRISFQVRWHSDNHPRIGF